MICFCKEVPEKEVKKALKTYPDASFKEIKYITKASTGCGRCALTLKKFIENNRPESKNNNQLKIDF